MEHVDDQLERLLERLHPMFDELDARDAVKKRAAARVSYRAKRRDSDACVTINHLGGGSTEHFCCSRNISRDGISLITQGFIHPGSQVSLSLRNVEGETVYLNGVVRHCRHLEGKLHEMGLNFNKPINPLHFVEDEGEAEALAASLRETTSLACRIFHLSSGIAASRLVQHHLNSTDVEIQTFETEGAIKDALKSSVPEIVLIDSGTQGIDSVQTCLAIRSLGFKGEIILITADDRLTKHADETFAINQVLRLPITNANIGSAVFDALARLKSQAMGSACSSMADDPDLLPIIEQFVEESLQVCQLLERSLKSEDLESIRQAAINLKGTGGSLGFETLSTLAQEVVVALDSSASVQESAGVIRDLIETCARIQAKPKFSIE